MRFPSDNEMKNGRLLILVFYNAAAVPVLQTALSVVSLLVWFYPNFAEGELLGEILSKNISVSNENIKGNLCCAWRSSIKWKVGLNKCGVQRDK
jgi:hypothetical protein